MKHTVSMAQTNRSQAVMMESVALMAKDSPDTVRSSLITKVSDVSRHDSQTTTFELDEKWSQDSDSCSSDSSNSAERDVLDLHTFARTGETDDLRLMLRQKRYRKEVDRLDDNGMAPIHYASRYNQLEAMRLLVERGKADVMVRYQDGGTALHCAARKKTSGQAETVQVIEYLMQRGADINAKDDYLATPLHFAARRGNEVVLKALLQYPQMLINAGDRLGATPLHEAVVYNHVQIAEILMSEGCLVYVEDNEGSTPLHLAAMEGDLQMVTVLVNGVYPARMKQFIDDVDHDWNTALHLAVENRCFPVVAYLIEKGADVNITCRPKSSADTPLHLACAVGHRQITEVLLANGACTDACDGDKALPLHRAAQYQNADVVECLLQQIDVGEQLEKRNSKLLTPLLMACCSRDNAPVVSLLLKYGADIKAMDDNERTTLCLATLYNQPTVVQVLLDAIKGKENKVLIDCSDKSDNTPLHSAARNGYLDIVQILLKAGAKHDIKNEDEETAFLLAAQNGHVDVCEQFVLKTKGKCLYDEEEDSNTALHLAAHAGHLNTVKFLMEKGADKVARSCESWTPLDYAAAAGHVEVVKSLLDEGVPVDPQDKSKITPLHLACSNGHADVVTVLLDAGANVSQQDAEGNNALDRAVSKNHEDVAAILVQSDKGHLAMLNDTLITIGTKRRRNTPIRKMIRRMPDVAKIVLDRCISHGPEGCSPEDPNFWIEFNFELLDDSYSRWDKATAKENQAVQDALYDIDGIPSKKAELYSRSSTFVKDNHPVVLMVRNEQESLLSHPLVLALLRRKWNIASFFYFAFLLFYAALVGLVSAYVVVATPPYDPSINMAQCEAGTLGNVQTEFEKVSKFFIWGLAAFGIVVELFQISATKKKYLLAPMNMFDWFTYVSAVLVTIDLTPCGVRKPWQWQLAAFSVFVAWMDMLLFLRRLPQIGIYVVMIVEIFGTFMRFFIVFFLFVLAFSLSFFVLLRNQNPFRAPWHSLIKTWVMMIGEMDFVTIFHSSENSTDYQDQVFYEESTYAIFVAFLVLMAIILMNLLTGLAVDDVNALQQHAKLKKMAMQIDLALDVEVALPKSLKNKTQCIVQKERVYPNRRVGVVQGIWGKVLSHAEGDLARKYYLPIAINSEGSADDQEEELFDLEQRLHKELDHNRAEMKGMRKKLDTIEQLLLTMVEQKKTKPAK